MRHIVAITPPDSRNGFACCGALQHVVGPGEAEQALERAVADPDSGLVILDERLVAEIGEERLRALEHQVQGILVVLPAPGKAPQEEDYAVRLIRRAIGYHVRVKR